MNKRNKQGKNPNRVERLYFRDVYKYDLLTDKQERELLEDIHNKIPGAENKLVTANLRFVAHEARKHVGNDEWSFLELVNEGNIGLLKAAKKFNKDKDVKFISYAVWWVRQAIQKAIFDRANHVHIPFNKVVTAKRFRYALEKNNGDFEKTIEMPEFIKHRDDIIEVLEKTKVTSLDQPTVVSVVDEENTQTLLDTLSVDPEQNEDFIETELRNEIENVIHHLPILNDKEEIIIRMYYGINFSSPQTLEEIGKVLGFTREKVRLVRDRALRKIYKNPEARERLKAFLGASTNSDYLL